jgi:hypothetical protein
MPRMRGINVQFVLNLCTFRFCDYILLIKEIASKQFYFPICSYI